MAMLFCIKIVQGDLTYSQVPRLLKEPVRKELEAIGLGELATEE